MKGLICTYVLTYGGALASLFNPFVGLLVYVCFAIIKPESMWFWSVPEGNYSRIVAIGLLVGWMLKGFGSWQFGRARGIVVALILFWLWSFVGIFIGIDATRSALCVEALSKIFLPFLVGITSINSMKQVKQLAWVIVLCEGYVALEFNLSYYGGYNRLWEEGFGNMDNNCNAIALVTCVGMAFFLGLHAQKWWLKALVFAAMGLMINAIFFSYSRGGMLALFITMPMAFVLIPKQPKHYLVFFLAVVLVWRLAGVDSMKRFETTFAAPEERDESAESRVRLWAGCWEMMVAHPLGLGPDNFPLMADRYGYKQGKEGHTLWLTVGAEFGFPGLACLVFFFGLCIVRLWPLTRERGSVADPWACYFARMVIAALMGFIVSAQFVSVKYLEHPYYIVLIGAAVLKLVSKPGERATDDGHLQTHPVDAPGANQTNAIPLTFALPTCDKIGLIRSVFRASPSRTELSPVLAARL